MVKAPDKAPDKKSDKKELPKEKPKLIVINRVRRTRRTFYIEYDHGDEEKSVNSADNARKGFVDAMDALKGLTCSILQVSPKWADELRVLGIDMGRMGGVDTVKIFAQKSLSLCGKNLPLHVPEVLMKHPTQEGRYTQPLTDKEAELIWEVIERAKDYIQGEREQGQLPLLDAPEDGEEGEEADDNTAPLPFK